MPTVSASIFTSLILQPPADPLAPRTGVFAEPWQAQVLATAHALIRAGHLTPNAWAEALGAALRAAEAQGAPDTEETYYQAALTALETVVPLAPEALAGRRAAWAEAYRQTPHGQPVTLPPA